MLAGKTSDSIHIDHIEPWFATSVAVVRIWAAPESEASPDRPSRHPSAGGGLDVDRLQRAVRCGDRVCPASRSCVLVAFGPGAGAVPPWVLARRLAGAAFAAEPRWRRRATAVDVTVGLAHSEPGSWHLTQDVADEHTVVGKDDAGECCPAPDGQADGGTGNHGSVDQSAPDDPSTLVRSALSAERAARHLLVTAPDGAGGEDPASITGRPSSAAVALDRLRPWAAPRAAGTTRRRDLLLHNLGGSRWPATASAEDVSPTGCEPLSTVAVVATGTGLGAQQLATRSAELATALGLPTSSLGFDDDLTECLCALRPDVVVVVLDDAPADPTWTSWSGGAWERGQRSVDAAIKCGASVVAIGGSAGALAAATERGATPLFNPDDLRSHLVAVSSSPHRLTSATSPDPVDPPDHVEALLRLTASERRVLYYLTGGWGATEIATELVVSLATVRTHIRAVLRKLDVRSQLAAVAIANTTTIGLTSRSSGEQGRLGA
ncbi:MAG: helix-turn-helix transcriptional regulator [Acidimicrobiales bacterium]